MSSRTRRTNGLRTIAALTVGLTVAASACIEVSRGEGDAAAADIQAEVPTGDTGNDAGTTDTGPGDVVPPDVGVGCDCPADTICATYSCESGSSICTTVWAPTGLACTGVGHCGGSAAGYCFEGACALETTGGGSVPPEEGGDAAAPPPNGCSDDADCFWASNCEDAYCDLSSCQCVTPPTCGGCLGDDDCPADEPCKQWYCETTSGSCMSTTTPCPSFQCNNSGLMSIVNAPTIQPGLPMKVGGRPALGPAGKICISQGDQCGDQDATPECTSTVHLAADQMMIPTVGPDTASDWSCVQPACSDKIDCEAPHAGMQYWMEGTVAAASDYDYNAFANVLEVDDWCMAVTPGGLVGEYEGNLDINIGDQDYSLNVNASIVNQGAGLLWITVSTGFPFWDISSSLVLNPTAGTATATLSFTHENNEPKSSGTATAILTSSKNTLNGQLSDTTPSITSGMLSLTRPVGPLPVGP